MRYTAACRDARGWGVSVNDRLRDAFACAADPPAPLAVPRDHPRSTPAGRMPAPQRPGTQSRLPGSPGTAGRRVPDDTPALAPAGAAPDVFTSRSQAARTRRLAHLWTQLSRYFQPRALLTTSLMASSRSGGAGRPTPSPLAVRACQSAASPRAHRSLASRRCQVRQAFRSPAPAASTPPDISAVTASSGRSTPAAYPRDEPGKTVTA